MGCPGDLVKQVQALESVVGSSEKELGGNSAVEELVGKVDALELWKEGCIPEIVSQVVKSLPGFIYPIVNESISGGLPTALREALVAALERLSAKILNEVEHKFVAKGGKEEVLEHASGKYLQEVAVGVGGKKVEAEGKKEQEGKDECASNEWLPAGTPVGIVGLMSTPKLNGTTGIVQGLDETTQRWKVQLIDGTFKSANVAT